MKDTIQTEIETPDGVGLLEQIYITELGHVMVRIFYQKKGIWINRRITNLESLLEGSGLKLTGEYKIKKRKVLKNNYG